MQTTELRAQRLRPLRPSGLTRARLRTHLSALLPGLIVVGLTLVWAVHDGGYDAETWYWGALASVGLLAATGLGLRGQLRLGRGTVAALLLFAAYVAWCYLSITWAQSPGDALQGANQALLYLLIFAVMLSLPWTAESATVALIVYVVGVGVIALVLLARLASADQVGSLVVGGRLAAPTGYFNATAALFTSEALAAIGLATRRELPALLRGLLLAFACGGLQLALIVQSRGWLFTLPLVALVAIVLVRDRLRSAAAAVIPTLGVLAILHRLLAVYSASGTTALDHAARRAGEPALVICAGALVVGALLAWGDAVWTRPPLSATRRRALGTALAVAVVVALAAGGTAATHGRPLPFVKRQWNGFSHEPTYSSSQSHFGDVGSGRYDFWRVSLDAFLANPIGGLGEDNFHDYYVTRRHTGEEPTSTHSIEFRLLAQTGAVGFVLFVAFLACTLRLAIRARRTTGSLHPAVAGIALLPLTVWLIHGSLDWFWEMPALSGPALGFLAVAAALGGEKPARAAEPANAAEGSSRAGRRPPRRRSAAARAAVALATLIALLTGVVLLGFPYLSVREVSLGNDATGRNPQQALTDFARAADLNPLSAVPGRLAGLVALQTGQFKLAQRSFEQAIAREPRGWVAWLGAGLAASALSQPESAHRYLMEAHALNRRQPVIQEALRLVLTSHPVSPAEALELLAAQ